MEFRLLGPLDVRGDDGTEVSLGGARPRALLALLLLHPNKAVSTDELIDGIWGDAPPASAQNALQVHVHGLRNALGADRIVTRPPGYLLRVERGELDVERFERLVAAAGRGTRWRSGAARRWPTSPASRSPSRGRSARGRAPRRARGPNRSGSRRRAARHRRGGARGARRGPIRTASASVPTRCSPSIAPAGRRTRSRHTATRAPRWTSWGSSRPPSSAHSSSRSSARILPSGSPPRGDGAAAPGALPADDDPARGTRAGDRGRDQPPRATRHPTRDTHRPRRDGQDAACARRGTRHGRDLRAVFVDLSAVADPALVVPTAAHVLGASESPGGDPVETVVTTLGGNPTLLVLDNLEQVLEAAVDVARLLDAAGELRVLATSRAPLRIMRERVYAVQPLPVPDLGADTARGIEHVAAVRLYVERAHAADPDFTITDENAGAIARICRALDGLPLALELAAARMRTLGAEGTAARLGERLSLLSRGARDLPERQRSLRATLDWSVQLLEADAAARARRTRGIQRRGVARCSRGRRCGERRAVRARGSARRRARDTQHRRERRARFGMLETVREYAAELLAGSGEEPEVRDRHLDWFLALVEGEGLYWQRNTDREWLDRIELEHDNYRTALDHAIATGDVERELRLANALRYFWRVRGYVVEGRRRLEAAVERSGSVEPALRARTLGEAGIMAFTGGDYERSRELWLQALPLIEEVGEPREIARAHFELGAWAHAQGALPEARRRYEPARQALAEVDDPIGQATVLGNLAVVYQATGEPARAREASEAALALYEGSGDLDGLAVTTLNMAYVELGNDDLPAAGRRLGEALAWAERLGHREVLAYAVGYGAELALALGRADDAAVLCGAFDQMFEVIDSVPQPDEVERHAKLLERLSTQIDVREAMARGNALPPDAVTALVRDVVAAT